MFQLSYAEDFISIRLYIHIRGEMDVPLIIFVSGKVLNNKIKKVVLGMAVSIAVLSCTQGVHAKSIGTGVASGDGVRMRKSPDAKSTIVEIISKGSSVEIMEEKQGWYKIKANSIVGWASKDYISSSGSTKKQSNAVTTTCTISSNNVNLRSDKSTLSSVKCTLSKGTRVNLVTQSGNWCKVSLSNGQQGWVYKDFVSLRGISTTQRGSTVSRNTPGVQKSSSSTASSGNSGIVEYAKQFMGVRYIYGGGSPSGFDCSGFVQYVYRRYGVGLNRVAASQANQGSKVDKSRLAPGDLVFFDTNGGHNYINHVGLYIGNGNFIHASSGRSAHKVVVSNLTGGFYNSTFMTARRILGN